MSTVTVVVVATVTVEEPTAPIVVVAAIITAVTGAEVVTAVVVAATVTAEEPAVTAATAAVVVAATVTEVVTVAATTAAVVGAATVLSWPRGGGIPRAVLEQQQLAGPHLVGGRGGGQRLKVCCVQGQPRLLQWAAQLMSQCGIMSSKASWLTGQTKRLRWKRLTKTRLIKGVFCGRVGSERITWTFSCPSRNEAPLGCDARAPRAVR